MQTFHFMYCFSRNEMKMGRTFRRRLIQPLNMGSFLTLPWVFFDMLDSLFFPMLYTAYCEKCGWKYKKISARTGHDPIECEYNQEYTEIIRDILTGKIVQAEPKFKEAAQAKALNGQRSAYNYLCNSRNFFSWITDVACVWFSISLFVLLFVLVVFPYLGLLVNNLEDVAPMGLR